MNNTEPSVKRERIDIAANTTLGTRPGPRHFVISWRGQASSSAHSWLTAGASLLSTPAASNRHPVRRLRPKTAYRCEPATQMVHRLTDLVHDRSLKDPDAFWAEAAETIDWYIEMGSRAAIAPGRRSTLVLRRDGQHVLTTRSIGTSRAAEPTQPALIYDSPVTGTIATFTFRELLDRGVDVRRRSGAARRLEGRPRHHLHADDSRGGDRDAGGRAARRHPLGRVRRLCLARAGRAHRRCAPEGRRHRPRAASSRDASSRTSRCSTRAIDIASHKPAQCIVYQRPMATAELIAGTRPRLARRRRRRTAARLRAGGRNGSALHPVHLGHNRPAERRSSATTAGISSRSTGR